MSAGGPDRSAPPPAGKTRPFSFPPFERQRLASGLELVCARRTGLPTVEALLQFPLAGGDRSPPSRPGLAPFTAALLDEGTRRRSGLELARELENLGASLSTGADWDAAHLELSMLASDLETGLERLAEVAWEPSFPADEVERVRSQWLAELLRRSDQPGLLADDLFAGAVYAKTPYRSRLRGTAAALREIDADDLRGCHETGYSNARASLLIGGDFDPGRILKQVSSLFGSLPEAKPESTAQILPAPGERRRILVLDRPQAAQTEIRIGHASVPRTHPDRGLLNVLNAVLGGKFTSRLNLNLRERNGFTYGVSSRFVGRRGPGPFVISMAVANESVGAAIAETLGEMERICAEPVSETELAEARSYLLGVFPYPFQTMNGLLSKLADLALYELPDDHYARTLEEIRNAGREELLRLARTHLHPERLVIATAGPAAQLTPQLEGLAAVELVALEDLDRD